MHERFGTILVTTDFSPLGDRAIGHAFRLGADHGAKVVLCHVMEIPIAPIPLYAQYFPAEILSPGVEQQIKDDALAALRERVPAAGELAAVESQFVVTRGLPAEEIVRVAGDVNADLIVISTHGHTGIKHVFLGSVSERVVRHAPCAVLVVR
jgi:nucleotide-binding universal stress UspA family protein